ncbi:probable WRKY transcription factor 4 [Cynara cardunculus var. scolymus]|uniref:probable WRKY transcription factor 4 n=1 Tax=Cynara cardunculus var. scolymus TaxID=59895 RepID=UPI000D62D731|nr:probable WRKY transcription factor 4 [Cynara cardunculus var. scolymus]
MDEKRRLISSSAPYLRPTISIPSSSTVENLFTGGGGRPGESPGPMTLISNFFSNNDVESDCRSFSQLLAGTMSSPAQIPGRILSRDSDAGADASGGGAAVDFQFSNAGRASGLVVTQASTFTIPPGLSPATLLDSPGFFLPAQVTTQAAQLQPKATTTRHRLPPPMPDHTTTKQSPEFSSSGGHSHSHSQPPSVAADKPSEDGYNWRKYGQKQVKGSEYPRSYYKCTNQNCRVKKKVERNLDGLVTEIIYNGQHNHQPPRSEYAGVGTSGEPESFKGQTGNFNHSRVDAMSMKGDQRSGSSDGKEASDDVTMPQAKRRNVEVKAVDPVSSHRTVTEPRIVVQATSEIDLLDDGYKWRKYGQKVVKGNRHPRSYYKCTSQGCKVRKHVERAASDPMAVITTYEGKHNHLVPVVRNNNHDTTKETASQLRPHGPIGHLRLKDEQIM